MKSNTQSQRTRDALSSLLDIESNRTVRMGGSEYDGVLLRLTERLVSLDYLNLEDELSLLCAEQWFLIYLESPEYRDLKFITNEEQKLAKAGDSIDCAQDLMGFMALELLCWLCVQGINPIDIQVNDFIEFYLIWYPDHESFNPQNIVHDRSELVSFFDFIERIGAPHAHACRAFMNDRSRAQLFALSALYENGPEDHAELCLAS